MFNIFLFEVISDFLLILYKYFEKKSNFHFPVFFYNVFTSIVIYFSSLLT
nr:MAG TPA: hypothetical protein [Caudoviricetes sp.]